VGRRGIGDDPGRARNRRKHRASGAAQDERVGAYSVPRRLVERIEQWAGSGLAPEQTLIASSWGMNRLPRHIALGKLKAMAGATRILAGRGEPALAPA
jgi:hypothetical protein